MKPTLILLAIFSFAALAPAADKEEKKDRKDRNEKKDDKKEEKKEEVRNLFEVTVEGARDEAAEADAKTFLGSIEGVKLDKCEKTDKGLEAVLSAGAAVKLSRGDVSKALKTNKDLKVSEFKAVRPGRDRDKDKDKDKDMKKDDKKDDRKTDDKKPEEKKAA